tara:strand:+ start:161 stop:904 length:744 start_codon:yes stop_codon:yes gene_type:complete
MNFSSPLVGSSSKLELSKSPFVLSPLQRKNSVIIRLLCKVNQLKNLLENESSSNLDDIFHEAFDNININDDDNLLISSLSSTSSLSSSNNDMNEDGIFFNNEDFLNLDYFNEKVLTNIIGELMKRKIVDVNHNYEEKKEIIEEIEEITTTSTTSLNSKSRGLTPRKLNTINNISFSNSNNDNSQTPLKTPTRLARQRAEKKKNFDIQVDKENQLLLSKIDSKSRRKFVQDQEQEQNENHNNKVELLL